LKKKKVEKKEKGKGKEKEKSNIGTSHISAHIEEVDDSTQSGPLSRAPRIEEVLDEDA
jgi:hypothetical protein